MDHSQYPLCILICSRQLGLHTVKIMMPKIITVVLNIEQFGFTIQPSVVLKIEQFGFTIQPSGKQWRP